jgi:simple sugar transport system permease protein
MSLLGLRLEKRSSPSLLLRALAPIGTAALALAASGLLIRAAGGDPLQALAAIGVGAFGSMQNLGETMVKAAALILVGLGMIVAFRTQVANIGGEGQIIMGAIAGTWLGLTLTGLSPALLFPIVVVGAFAAGALWGAIAGALKARLQLNEVIVTIMLNYLAIYTLNWLVRGPMRAPGLAGGFPQSEALAQAIWWPRLAGTRMHIGVLLALALAVLVSIFLYKTPWGYRLRAVGANPEAARYGGIVVGRTILWAMILSGGLAGIAGAGEIYGLHHRLLDGISSGYGYTGIVVALLGKLNPFATVLAGIFFAALAVGMEAMQRSLGTPFALIASIQGLVVLMMLLADVLVEYRIRRA